MKRILVLCFTISSFFQSSIAQYAVPESIINCSALVQVGGGFGSGFFIRDSSDIYFVTARHVVMNSNHNTKSKKVEHHLKAPKIEVRWYPRNAESSNPNLMIIDISSLKASGNLVNGQSVEDDFVIMRIARVEQKGGYGAIHYSSSVQRIGPDSSIDPVTISATGKFQQTNIGNEVIMVGYPKSLGLKNLPQYDFNRPLIRKGIVAGKNTNLESIVLDCPSYAGNSGGAVFEILDKGLSQQYKLVGIVSQFIPLEEVWINPNYGIKNVEWANSGYSIVIPIEKAIKKIETIRKNTLK